MLVSSIYSNSACVGRVAIALSSNMNIIFRLSSNMHIIFRRLWAGARPGRGAVVSAS